MPHYLVDNSDPNIIDTISKIVSANKDMKTIEISFANKKTINRTANANRYYHKIIIPHQIEAIYDSWGYALNPAEMHHVNKYTFFAVYHYDESKDKYTRKPGSTKTLDMNEFVKRLSRIRHFFYENFNYDIPLPVLS